MPTGEVSATGFSEAEIVPCLLNSGTEDESSETEPVRRMSDLDFTPARRRMPSADMLRDVGEGIGRSREGDVAGDVGLTGCNTRR